MMPNPLSHLDRRHFLALGAIVACGETALAQAPAGFDLNQLMQMLAQVRSGTAVFTETRTVAMLDRTLKSSGRLSFEAPDTFVRETLTPRNERIAVVGNSVSMSMGSRNRTLPLDSVPEAAVIMEAIRGTLTGNREAIERHFDATVTGAPQRWALELKPRDARLRGSVTSVRLSGDHAAVREVAVAMADGDRSVMSIEPIEAGSTPAASGAPRSAGSASAPD